MCILVATVVIYKFVTMYKIVYWFISNPRYMHLNTKQLHTYKLIKLI